MEISITSHRESEPLDLSAFERLARYVLEREEVFETAELSLAIVDLDEMASLSERFRGVEGPTDVLAFGCDEPCAVASDEPITLGDVVIAPEVAERQAREYGHTVEEELNLLLVHGILHLLGYEHDSDEDAAVMAERERILLLSYADSL